MRVTHPGPADSSLHKALRRHPRVGSADCISLSFFPALQTEANQDPGKTLQLNGAVRPRYCTHLSSFGRRRPFSHSSHGPLPVAPRGNLPVQRTEIWEWRPAIRGVDRKPSLAGIRRSNAWGPTLSLLILLAAGCKTLTSPIDQPLGNASVLVGVSTHGLPPSGFDIVRRDEDGLGWVGAAQATGAIPIVIVGYWSPTDGFVARCARAAETGAWIEFWNEPNLAEFWAYNAETGRSWPPREPNPEQWVSLLAECRRAAPDAILMGPAIGGDWDWSYLERATAAGMMRYVDVVTVHGYASSPERLARDIGRVRTITGATRVAISEWGFHTGPRQAEEVRRALVAAAGAGLEFLVLYDGRDDGYTLTPGTLAEIDRWRSKP